MLRLVETIGKVPENYIRNRFGLARIQYQNGWNYVMNLERRTSSINMAGLNLLAAIVIHWNTAHLGEAVRQRKHAGLTVEPELMAHISPLGWAHILLTGEYRWPKCR